jgi:hypothetical protein
LNASSAVLSPVNATEYHIEHNSKPEDWKSKQSIKPAAIIMGIKVPIALQLLELVLQEGTCHPRESQRVRPGRKVINSS